MKHLSTIHSRYRSEWLNNEKFGPYYATFGTVDGLIDALKTRRQMLEGSGHLTKDGLTAGMREFAAKNIVPKLRRERHKLELSAARLKEARDRLGVVKVNSGDGKDAVRAQIRDRFAAMSEGDRKAMIAKGVDQTTLEALLEAPSWISKISDADRATLVDAHLAKTKPEVIGQISEIADVLQVVGSTIDVALYELKRECMFLGNEAAFDQFMTDASAEVETELERVGDRDGYLPAASIHSTTPEPPPPYRASA